MYFCRAFERAYQIYQNDQFLEDIRKKDSKNKENVESQKNAVNIKKLISSGAKDSDDHTSCLIDLGSENGPQLNNFNSKDKQREYFQTTWVSFEWWNEAFKIIDSFKNAFNKVMKIKKEW